MKYTSYHVAVRNKAGNFTMIGQDLGDLEFAKLIAINKRSQSGREVQVREYEHEELFGKKTLIQVHDVPN